MKNLMLGLLVGLFLVGCCPCRKTSKSPVDVLNKQWSLVEMDGKQVIADQNFELMFTSADSTINGTGDCNRFFGKYTLGANGKITLSPLGSTRAFCANQALEDRFLKMLGEIDSYEMDGALLMLLDGGELKAILKTK